MYGKNWLLFKIEINSLTELSIFGVLTMSHPHGLFDLLNPGYNSNKTYTNMINTCFIS